MGGTLKGVFCDFNLTFYNNGTGISSLEAQWYKIFSARPKRANFSIFKRELMFRRNKSRCRNNGTDRLFTRNTQNTVEGFGKRFGFGLFFKQLHIQTRVTDQVSVSSMPI